MRAREAAAALGSMGVALGACTVPAAGKPGFVLGDDEIELGLGIHGEKGVERSAMRPADALVDTVLEMILRDRGFGPGGRVAAAGERAWRHAADGAGNRRPPCPVDAARTRPDRRARLVWQLPHGTRNAWLLAIAAGSGR